MTGWRPFLLRKPADLELPSGGRLLIANDAEAGEASSEFLDRIQETGCPRQAGRSEIPSLQDLGIGMLCAYLLRVFVSKSITFLAQSSGRSAPLVKGGSGANF